jgi:hypothetical protein
LTEDLRATIKDNTCELYKTAKDLNINVNDAEYLKMISQDTLPMLNEIEVILNSYMENFKEYENDDQKLYEQVQKTIKQENRTKARNDNAEREM